MAVRMGCIVAFAGTLLGAAPTLAHKLHVFAAADGRLIQGQAYFSGGAPAVGLTVLVQDESGKRLAQSHTDAEGVFQVEAAAPLDHVVVVQTGDGHRAEWRIHADELAVGFPAGAESIDTGLSAKPPESAPATPRDTASSAGAGSDPQSNAVPDFDPGPDQALDPAVLAAIERAVARQVRPLREETQAAREAVQLRDLLGGLGYILGLTGLGLWWHCRRASRALRTSAPQQEGPG